jgi:crotonobetainyl-CoA:carnitine CoA-transferase CaiB-like acyl-CoA transferase
MTAPALDGVRVLDLSRLLPGGFCSLLLADFGADVLKVEDTGIGDYVRWSPPYYEGADDSAKGALFLALNRNKRSIRIDLKTEQGREVLLRLAKDADVLLESFRPGVLDRLGVGYDALREANPGLVICAITGYGQDGPLRDRSGHDMNYLGLVGLLGLTGEAGEPPIQAAGQIADIGGGALMAAFGIMAALRHRDATGAGQLVEVNLLSSALTGLVNHSSAFVAGRTVPYRMGNAHPSVYPYEPLPTADNDLIVAAANDGQFRKLCEVLGIPEVADDPRFARNADRTANREQLHPLLVGQLAKRGANEWFELLVEAGVPSGPINTIDGGFAMAERFELEPVVAVGDGERSVPTTRHPIRFSATPARYRLPPPELDEHGDELRKWLSVPEEEAEGETTGEAEEEAGRG